MVLLNPMLHELPNPTGYTSHLCHYVSFHSLIDQQVDCRVDETQFGLSHSAGDSWWLLAIVDLPHPKHPHLLLHLFNLIVGGCGSLDCIHIYTRSVNSTQLSDPQFPPSPCRTINALHSSLSNRIALEPSLIVLIKTSLHLRSNWLYIDVETPASKQRLCQPFAWMR